MLKMHPSCGYIVGRELVDYYNCCSTLLDRNDMVKFKIRCSNHTLHTYRHLSQIPLSSSRLEYAEKPVYFSCLLGIRNVASILLAITVIASLIIFSWRECLHYLCPSLLTTFAVIVLLTAFSVRSVCIAICISLLPAFVVILCMIFGIMPICVIYVSLFLAIAVVAFV